MSPPVLFVEGVFESQSLTEPTQPSSRQFALAIALSSSLSIYLKSMSRRRGFLTRRGGKIQRQIEGEGAEGGLGVEEEGEKRS